MEELKRKDFIIGFLLGCAVCYSISGVRDLIVTMTLAIVK